MAVAKDRVGWVEIKWAGKLCWEQQLVDPEFLAEIRHGRCRLGDVSNCDGRRLRPGGLSAFSVLVEVGKQLWLPSGVTVATDLPEIDAKADVAEHAERIKDRLVGAPWEIQLCETRL